MDYCLIFLEGILQKNYLDHLTLIAEVIHILNSDFITSKELETAGKLLSKYVHLFEEIFGKENMTFNVHLLTHLADTVRNWGPLWVHAAFRFESWNRRLP